MASKRKAKSKVVRKKRKVKKVMVDRPHRKLGLSEEDRTKELRARDKTHSPNVSQAPRRRDANPGENYRRAAGRIRWES